MKKILIWVLVAAQVAVLAYIAGEREWVQRTGQRVWLRTAPIDPRDPMRGDYVRLRYEANDLPWAICRGEIAEWNAKAQKQQNGYYDYRFTRSLRDEVVFAELKIDEHGLGTVVALHAVEPRGKTFLRGRVERINEQGVEVRYGIEALFTEQGVAQKMEDSMRRENEGRPMRVEVALGRGGLAVMRRHEWENLSLRIELERAPEEQAAATANTRSSNRRDRTAVAVKVTLKNHGLEPIALVVRGGGRSFRLVPANPRWGGSNNRWSWAGETVWPIQAAAAPLATDVRVLQPGETLTEQLDLTSDQWSLFDSRDKSGQPQVFSEVTEDAWSAWFRLEYVSPTQAQCAGLDLPAKLWLGRVASRSFNPTGGVD